MAYLHLVDDLAIQQGATFALGMSIVGDDYLLWIPKAQIRKNYADVEEEVLAEFIFSDFTFDGTYTNFTMRLLASQTATLPRTKPYKAKKTPVNLPYKEPAPRVIGTAAFLYDFEITSPDENVTIKLIQPSYVEVLGEITV